MKIRSSIAFTAVALVFAACSGGGGSATSGVVIPQATLTPAPTATPVTYTAQLVWRGVGSAIAVQSAFTSHRGAMSANATPLPIMLVNTCVSSSSTCTIDGSGGSVQVQISPMPPTQPTVSYTASSQAVTIAATPAPQSPSPEPTGVVSEEAVAPAPVTGTTGNVQGAAGTITATISGSVTATASLPVLTYPNIGFDCVAQTTSEYASGYALQNGALVPEITRGASDIYVSGSACFVEDGAFYSGESDETIHFPYGGVVLAYAPFSSVTASQWTNTVTSADEPTLANGGLTDDLLLFKTADGHIVKMYMLGMTANGTFNATYQISGSSIDGF